jgi:hypothetical protein
MLMTATLALPDVRTHSTFIEGIKAGALGATGVALWFFVFDALTGNFLYTPRAMGEALGGSLGLGVPGPSLAIIGYTIFHYAAFIAVATVVAAIVHRSMKDPTILAAALLVFVASEVAFYVFMSALDAASLFGRFGWVQIAVSNILGASLVGVYLWKTHPGLKGNLDEGLGTTPERAH